MAGLGDIRNKVKQNSSSIILQKAHSAVMVKKVANSLIEFWDIYILNYMEKAASKVIDVLIDDAIREDPNGKVTQLEDLMLRSKSKDLHKLEIPYVNALFGDNTSDYINASQVGYVFTLDVTTQDDTLWIKCANNDEAPKNLLDSCNSYITFSNECKNAFEEFALLMLSFMKEYANVDSTYGNTSLYLKWSGCPIETLFINHIKETSKNLSYIKLVPIALSGCYNLELDVKAMILAN